MSSRRTQIFVFRWRLTVAALGLIAGWKVLPEACGLDSWDYACDPARVDVFGTGVLRPAVVGS